MGLNYIKEFTAGKEVLNWPRLVTPAEFRIDSQGATEEEVAANGQEAVWSLLEKKGPFHLAMVFAKPRKADPQVWDVGICWQEEDDMKPPTGFWEKILLIGLRGMRKQTAARIVVSRHTARLVEAALLRLGAKVESAPQRISELRPRPK